MSTHPDAGPPDDGEPSVPSRSLLVLFATETGTAEDAAHRVARRCRALRFHCRVLSVDAYPLDDLVTEPLVIFIVSTTGAGKEPRSMTPLWTTLLRSDLPADLFDELQFAVFGLGDTAYEKFCWPAKLLERRLQSLGATVLCPRGEGDEQHSIGADGALLPWTRALEEKLLELYPIPAGNARVAEADDLPPARVILVDEPPPSPSGRHNCSVSPSSKPPELRVNPDPRQSALNHHGASLVCNRRITAKDWDQDVRHLEFEYDQDIEYAPGDVAIIYPKAAPEDVDAFLIEMGWANIADDAFTVHPSSPDNLLPAHAPPPSQPTTLRALFMQHLDFNAVPRRSFFELIKHFASEDLEREKLDEFCAEEGDGADDLYDYCTRARRTIREVLSDFHSVHVPRAYIFDAFPPLRPRYFSIASSVKTHPRQIQLCVAIVRYRTKMRRARRGVCTSYLASLQPGDTLTVGTEKGTMRLPPDPQIPIICVGPGTGVAPMRAMIEQRVVEGARNNSLYFGCRSAEKDQHYASEWDSHAENGSLVYRLAASRDGPEGVARTYVQHLMAEDKERLGELLGRGAWVYISGSAGKMPLAVKEALRDAVKVEEGRTSEDGSEMLKAMERDGRLFEECWS